MGRFLNADAFASTGQGILGNNMFAYCGNNPVNCSDPTGYRRKFWYALFQAHQPGYIHRRVQEHILAMNNHEAVIYAQEFYLPGIGRADIVKPSTNEAWEIKHGGSTPDSEIRGIENALTQLEKYTVESTGLHPGSAGEFAGFFAIKYKDSIYAVIYCTPDAGAVLYYVFPIKDVKKVDYVFLPSTTTNVSVAPAVAALSLLLGAGGSGYAAKLEKAYET